MEKTEKIDSMWDIYTKNKNAAFNFGWQYANDILYKMCNEDPKVDDSSHIAGKLILIGRAYAAALERNSTHKNTDEQYFEIANKKGWIDINNRISADSLNSKEVIELHEDLTKLIGETTESNNVSLASKYLHFHKPDYFAIYDTRASKAVNYLVGRWSKDFLEFLPGYDVDETGNKNYVCFLSKALKIKNHLEEKEKIKITFRELDDFLLFTFQNCDEEDI